MGILGPCQGTLRQPPTLWSQARSSWPGCPMSEAELGWARLLGPARESSVKKKKIADFMKSLILACKTQHLANFNAKKTRKPALFQHFYSKNMKRCRFSCFFDPEISRMLCFTMQNQLVHEILHFFFFFTELSPAGTPSPLLTSHRPDDGKSLSTCALLIT